MNKQEAEWQAESDASTLAEAEVIKNDPKRLEAAKDAAERMAKEQEIRAEALRKIAPDLKLPKGKR